LNFYGNRTSGTFGVAATLKADPMATPKEPLFANALIKNRILETCLTKLKITTYKQLNGN